MPALVESRQQLVHALGARTWRAKRPPGGSPTSSLFPTTTRGIRGPLERVAERFRAEPQLDGLTGRGRPPGRLASWKADSAPHARQLLNCANAATTFLRRELVESVGEFDENLGLGSGRRTASGEETDYLVRAVSAGARIAYDPSLVVRHDVR